MPGSEGLDSGLIADSVPQDIVAAEQVVETAELHRASFEGNAREYFGIWIVNMLLTLVTLGIYAPWAKVRRNRYFSANTVLIGRSFDYHATGGQLLKGWLIVAVYLVGYDFLSSFYPIASLVVAVIVMIVLPWIVNKGLRFKARMTSYSNIRFQFEGRLSRAYLSVLLGGLLSLFTLGLLAPVASLWYQRYLFNGIRYGDRSFRTEGRLWPLYKALFLPALIMIIGVVPAAVVAGYIMSREFSLIPDFYQHGEWWQAVVHALFSYAAAIPILLAYFFMTIIYRTGVRNVMWSAAFYDGKHRLVSDVPRLKYAWILLSNTVATLATFGLLRPWAGVRERKFLAVHTGLIVVGNLDEVRGNLSSAESAFGSEFLDSDGFDFGF
jgi:uncharacterized membrane protein YjgN (DUF898 family)